MKLDRVLYTAKTHTTGDREGGASRSDDGRLDVTFSPPGKAGTTGTNPEQVFAAGWSTCYMGAIKIAAGRMKVTLPADMAIDAEVDLGMTNGVYGLAARLHVSMPGVEPQVAQDLLSAAHEICPYSRATRGNIDVATSQLRTLTGAVATALGVALFTAPVLAQAGAVPVAYAYADSSQQAPNPARADAIRPYRISVPEEALVDLKRRIADTRWPERETVNDESQGVQLARIQALVEYWGTTYDWRKAEAKLNALPQFVTTIDGVEIQFVHVRSKHANALPLIITHGWPGSILELVKVIGPLTDPESHGGRAEDAFDVVIPSMPGYGFSGKPLDSSWGPERIGLAWAELMKRLGYTRYVAQGGDWGAIVSEVMAIQEPAGLVGVHTNMPGTVPPHVVQLVRTRQPVPAGFSDAEKAAYAALDIFYNHGFGYAEMMNTRPQTLGYSLADSPVGMAAFFYEKFATWTYTDGQPERALTRDEMLDDITLYWLTNTGTSSSRSYWIAAQLGGGPFTARDIRNVPVAVTVFPGEIYRAPRSWTEQTYHNLIYFNEVEKGGHFAAWEEPHLFAAELRAAFASVR